MEDYATLDILNAGDGIALLVFLGISTTYEHHAYHGTLVKLDIALVEVAIGNTLEEIYNVALESEHNTLGLGVAHAAVVFDHHRFAIHIDKTKEDETLVVDTFRGKTIHSGTDNAVLHLLHPLLGGKRNGSDATHTTSVQTSVALANALVVLSLGQNLIVGAVGENEYRAFDAAEVFLDDHACRGIAKHTSKHLLELFLCLFESGKNEHTLTGTKSVSLQYVWSLECFEEFQSFLKCSAIEGLIFCSRDVMALHKCLGKVLGAFENSSCL